MVSMLIVQNIAHSAFGRFVFHASAVFVQHDFCADSFSVHLPGQAQ